MAVYPVDPNYNQKMYLFDPRIPERRGVVPFDPSTPSNLRGSFCMKSMVSFTEMTAQKGCIMRDCCPPRPRRTLNRDAEQDAASTQRSQSQEVKPGHVGVTTFPVAGDYAMDRSLGSATDVSNKYSAIFRDGRKDFVQLSTGCTLQGFGYWTRSDVSADENLIHLKLDIYEPQNREGLYTDTPNITVYSCTFAKHFNQCLGLLSVSSQQTGFHSSEADAKDHLVASLQGPRISVCPGSLVKASVRFGDDATASEVDVNLAVTYRAESSLVSYA